jgi:tripartite-type tricarboxylate transporter receptor subunit TctC
VKQSISNLRRSLVLLAAASLLVALAAPLAAQAQAWPSKPIKFVVPYPAGGAADVTARIIGAKLGESLGQAVIVENKAGANGIIGLDYVAKSTPDGYTLLSTNLSSHGTGPAVYKKLPYDPLKDFAPITLMTIVPMILVVNPNLPVKTVPELLAYTKAHPGKMTIASAGSGSSNHLAAELFNTMAGVKLMHVPYKGDTPAMLDVMSGNVDVMLPTVVAAMPHLKTGKLRALAIGSAKRTPSLPDLPTVSESGVPGYVGATWGGVLAPAGTPPEIVARLNKEINGILKQPDVAAKLAGLGAETVGSTPEEFGTFLKEEIRKWTKVAKDNAISID